MKSIVAIAVMAAAFAAAPASATLFINGSFETPPVGGGSFTQYGNGGNIGGWTVTGAGGSAVLAIHSTYVEPSVDFSPQDGLVHLDLTGAGNTGPNAVSQTVNLAAGWHEVAFYVGNVGGGSAGNQGVYNGTSSVDLLINGNYVATYSNSAGAAGTTNWAQFSYAFNQAGGPTTFTFRSATLSGDNYVGLDNVSLNAVPEPGTWAMMIGGFGLMGGLIRRRSGKLATA